MVMHSKIRRSKTEDLASNNDLVCATRAQFVSRPRLVSLVMDSFLERGQTHVRLQAGLR